MGGETVKLLLVYLCFAETLSISDCTSTAVDVINVVVSTPILTASTAVDIIFPEMTIQPSTTLASQLSSTLASSQDLLASSAAEKQRFTTIVPSESKMSSVTSLMPRTSISLSSLTVTVAPTPMTSDEVTSTIVPSTDHPETTYFTETTTVADSETTIGGTTATTLLPISTEILALIGIGLGGASCLCIVVFFLGYTMILTCRGCRKRRQKAKREIQDTMFRSATLQRPLGDTIRMTIENPTYKDMSTQGMDMTNASTIDRKESIIGDNGYSW